MEYDALIIGAGMAGLGAGIRLAHYGKKVCILEQHNISGGLNSHYAKDGYRFDVGLHAMTNFADKKTKQAPLNKLLRQLRISYDDLDIVEQNYSKISFPNIELEFSNDVTLLDSEINKYFPHCIDQYIKLKKHVLAYDELSLNSSYISSREVVQSFIKDPLLVNMIFCPLMYYGSACENDMDYSQFCIMFKSIFMEGFCRPQIGVRHLLRILNKRYKESGGTIKLATTVKKILSEKEKAYAVELENGEIIKAKKIFSSAGLNETMSMTTQNKKYPYGQLSFVESILIVDKLPTQKSTITFFNKSEEFEYKCPKDKLVDYNSGVICYPNHFKFTDKPLNQKIIRITNLANYSLWRDLSKKQYEIEKEKFINKQIKIIKQIQKQNFEITYKDSFTPLTVKKFTLHKNGAIYGSPHKVKDGKTQYKNLYIIGTDQGFLGIVGALLSGISMANLYGLR